MFSARCFALSSALLSLIASTSATFGNDVAGKTNVAMYYGQGPSYASEAALGLAHFCDNNDVDIIPLGFLNIYLAQGNGYPGTNFAASCWADVYSGPGYHQNVDHTKDQLHSHCPSLVSGIGHCQDQGKKILLSLGGAVAKDAVSYELTSDQDAIDLADFLWGAFGPKVSGSTYPRPFDLDSAVQEVDGFDFDIESIQPGEQAYYVTLISQLRSHFPKGPNAKQYIITGAPQCIVPDANMGHMISNAVFDILFVQYYNTDQCSGRNWVTANPNYATTGVENASGFKTWFNLLEANLITGSSKDAKVYFGLPGSTDAAHSTDYLVPSTEIAPFIEAYFCNPRFGGVMIWEAGYSEGNVVDNKTFQKRVKDVLIAASTNSKDLSCATTPSTTTTSSATPTPTLCCTKTYTVKSGDNCFDIGASNHLSVAQLQAMNPILGSNDQVCNIFPEQVLCIEKGACTTTSTTSTTSSTSSSTTTTTSTTSSSSSSSVGPTTSSSSSIASSTSTTSSTSSSSSSSSSTSPSTTSSPTTSENPTTSSSSSSSYEVPTISSSSSSISSSSSSEITSSATSSISSTSSYVPETTSSSSSSSSTSSYVPETTTSSSSSSSTSSYISETSSTSSYISGTSSTSSYIPETTSSSTSSATYDTTTTSSTSASSTSFGPSDTATTSSTTSSFSSSAPYGNSTTSSTVSTSSVVVETTGSATSTDVVPTTTTSVGSTVTDVVPTTTSGQLITTTTTKIYTITSCPPVVTNCPYGQITTEVQTITTTYCPATTTLPPVVTSTPTQYTTSVVYTTLIYTITACPATVTDCPAKIGSVTTETRVLYTTICPVSATTTPGGVFVVPTTVPVYPVKEISGAPSPSGTTTLSSTTTIYNTVYASKSTFTVVVQPVTTSVVPQPSVTKTPVTYSVVPSGSPVKPTGPKFTGGAGNVKVGGLMAVVACVAGLMAVM